MARIAVTVTVFVGFSLSVNDTLDDMLEDSGDEEETSGIVNKVLDEIGIEISGKVSAFRRTECEKPVTRANNIWFVPF